MNRKLILRSLNYVVCLCLVGTGGALGWLWRSSAPLSEGVVKGASIQLAAAKASPSLLPYPEPVDKPQVPIRAKEYALVHAQSGKLVSASASLDPVPIASTTKLMTAYLAATRLNPDSVVTVSRAAASQTGSLAGIYAGEAITVRGLMYGLLLVSGNDAAYALAEAVGKTLTPDPSQAVPRFVRLMNDTAKGLGMASTEYKDPAGLNDEGRSTAVDLARIAAMDAQDPLVRQVIGTSDIAVSSQNGAYRHEYHNSNRLLADMPYAGMVGGKTGFTDAAGHCLVAVADRDGKTLVAVILHTYDNTNDASALEARKLLDVGFSQAVWQ